MHIMTGCAGSKHCKCGVMNNKKYKIKKEETQETSDFCSFQRNINTLNARDCFAECTLAQQSPPKKFVKAHYEGYFRENKQYVKIQWLLLLYCHLYHMITFLYLSVTSFNNTGKFWALTYLQTLLAICTLICFRDRRQDTETAAQAGLKASKEYFKCVALVLFAQISEKSPYFLAMLD